jgi:anti-sigma regulatory factor (Ser/Thr protein kinase)
VTGRTDLSNAEDRQPTMPERDPQNNESYELFDVPSTLEAVKAPERAILDQIERHGYSEEAVFAIKLALEEALTNAVKHGNQGDPAKRVVVKFSISEHKAVIVVRDEGKGFDPEEIPDPTAPMPTPTPPMPQAEGQTEPAAPESEAELVPVPGAQSPFSVPEGDPAVSAETVTFASQGDNITAYLAQPAEAAPGSAPYPAPTRPFSSVTKTGA